MTLRRKIPQNVQEQVRQQAQYLCEYCHAAEQWQYVRFTVDHVVPIAQNGPDTVENLALACFHCNRRKTDNRTAVDPETGDIVPLFSPREHAWNDHFIWSSDGLQVIGTTPIGRATVVALDLNRVRVLHIRAADLEIGRHPPSADPIQP